MYACVPCPAECAKPLLIHSHCGGQTTHTDKYKLCNTTQHSRTKKKSQTTKLVYYVALRPTGHSINECFLRISNYIPIYSSSTRRPWKLNKQIKSYSNRNFPCCSWFFSFLVINMTDESFSSDFLMSSQPWREKILILQHTDV